MKKTRSTSLRGLSRLFSIPLAAGRHGKRRRRGAAVVEFAIVAPVFLTLVFGIIEIGRMVMVQQIITNGSRQGARTAILEGATASGVQSAVNTFLANSSIAGATITVSPTDLSSAKPGDAITVTVSIPFNDVSWNQAPWFLDGASLTASTLMRREGIP